jgi:acetyltransferase-like isoleucine patch superfamily enzyme/glycosyltransferase involved in cell wall biosynthesis
MLLSICIPTKNRADLLHRSIQSIVAQKSFWDRDDVEIVISDNASTDNTPKVAEAYVKQFKGRIHYHRNSNDLIDVNFERALRHGKGEFLKLANDSLLWLHDSLEAMLWFIEATRQSKPALFFLNQSRQTAKPVVEVNSVDEFLRTTSYFISWIGGFGIWKTQLDDLPDFSRYSHLHLGQVDAVLRVMAKRGNGYVSNIPFCQIQNAGRKGGYNIAEVFGNNYLKILRGFSELISEKTYQSEKRDVLEKHIIPFYFDSAHDFGGIDIEQALPEYVSEPYFKEALARGRAAGAAGSQANLIQQAPALWRERNGHNETVIRTYFNFDKVEVGTATYGPLNIHEWGNPDERLTIGNYVSIAEGVTFLLGGNHSHQGITTFPVKVKFMGQAAEAQTKGPITVGDDVWLGHNALILSGVTIGQGSVIAAGSVVTRDVPPYAIVGGNPAQVLKFRFSEPTIKELLKIDYSKVLPAHLARLGAELYKSEETPEFANALRQLIALSVDIELSAKEDEPTARGSLSLSTKPCPETA